MVDTETSELQAIIENLRRQLAAVSQKVEKLEKPAAAAAAPAEPAAAPAEPAGITEEEILAIAGALAAYFGVRVHIKQIRLISSPAWAQQGRVSIQASHRLHS
jgi:methylmalonyl-CoA carboxyltransferase large subunit